MQRRIYLDQAATSWPKLSQAIEAAERFTRECGATSGRGTYASSREADGWVTQARHNLARLVGASDASDVAFCSSGTHALNAAISGLVREGDCVLTTAIEHNSVLRPLEHCRQHRKVRVEVVPCDDGGLVDLAAAERLAAETSPNWIVLSHASNVTGCIQDVAAFGRLARRHGAGLMLDASQTIGYVPIEMTELGVDVLAGAGHKGLRALSGTGFLAVAKIWQKQLAPLMFGGTGLASELVDSEPEWPHCIEVGNLNLPAVVSMAAAAEHWLKGGDQALQSWRASLQYFLSALREHGSGRWIVIGHRAGVDHLPVVSLQLVGWDIQDAAAVLDASFGIEVRAGFHCAALIHSAICSRESGGTLRFSLGHDTPIADLDAAVQALVALHKA